MYVLYTIIILLHVVNRYTIPHRIPVYYNIRYIPIVLLYLYRTGIYRVPNTVVLYINMLVYGATPLTLACGQSGIVQLPPLHAPPFLPSRAGVCVCASPCGSAFLSLSIPLYLSAFTYPS